MPGTPLFDLQPILTNALEVKNGRTVTGTIKGANFTAATAQTVLLYTDTEGAVVDASVTISQGVPTATFTLTVEGVPVGDLITITAFYYDTMQQIKIRVAPASLGGLEFADTHVVGGNSINMTVSIDSTDNTNGVTVSIYAYVPPGGYANLFSSIPSTVTIPAGSLSQTFSVTTRPVNRNVYGSVRAMFGGNYATATIYITT